MDARRYRDISPFLLWLKANDFSGAITEDSVTLHAYIIFK